MRRRHQAIYMTIISDFVQQSHNFIARVVKLPQGSEGIGVCCILADGR